MAEVKLDIGSETVLLAPAAGALIHRLRATTSVPTGAVIAEIHDRNEAGGNDIAGIARITSQMKHDTDQTKSKVAPMPRVSRPSSGLQTFEVDMTVAYAALAHYKTRDGDGLLSPIVFIAKAAIDALMTNRHIAAAVYGGEYAEEVIIPDGITLAISTAETLPSTPTAVARAESLSLFGIGRAINEQTVQPHSPTAAADRPVICIVDMGSTGCITAVPPLVEPAAASLGVGAIVERPTVVIDSSGASTLGIRRRVALTLVYDYRLVSDRDAGVLLGAIKSQLEDSSFYYALGLNTEA